MKLVLVQSLEGITGEIARIIAKNSVIMYGGDRFERIDAGKTTYIKLAPPIEPNSFFSWRALVNNEMIKQSGKFEFSKIICIDWFGAHAGISISESRGTPIISIFTSTEEMRGMSEISGLISECEKNLYQASERVIGISKEIRMLGNKVEIMDLQKIGEEIENIDADMGVSTN